MKTSTGVFFFLFTIFYFNANAQLTIGIQGGLSNAWEDYGDVGLPDDAEIDIRGFNISGMMYYEVNPYLSLGVEPGMSKRGAACVPGWNRSPFPTFNGDTKLLLHYLEIPLMAEGRLPIWKGKIDLFGKIGYGASALALALEEETDFLTESDTPTKTKRLIKFDDDRLRRLDHGLYSAAGIRLHMKAHSLFASVNHYRGMRDADSDNKSLNRDIGLRIGWMVRL